MPDAQNGVFAHKNPVSSPAAERNKGPISDLMQRVLPDQGTVLEVGSGTGQHIVHFARQMPNLAWQPSERDERSLEWIGQRVAAAALPNIRAPLRLDVTERPWPSGPVQALVCINLIHIAPWSAAQGLMGGAATVLDPGGILFLYGPYVQTGIPTAPSNKAFDEQLRSRNRDWGLRHVDDVVLCARGHGLGAPEIYTMPANNLSLIFRKTVMVN